MKFFYDLFPIILFFVSYHQADAIAANTPVGQWLDPAMPEQIAATLIATGVAIIASFIQVGGHWLKHRRTERMHLISLALITVLGSITILLQDPAFIQWKPTLINWLFAAVFLGSHLVGDKCLVQRMMSSQLTLPVEVWNRLNLAWVVFFIISGVLNLYVAFYYGLELDAKTRMDIWVDFKLFGLMGLTIVFIVAQGFYLARYMQDDDSDAETPNIDNK
jgi:intracellular septation protein